MDIAEFINAMGGGLSSVVLVVSGWANWIQYQRNSALQDKILAMAEAYVRESRDLLTDTNKTTSANAEVLRRAVQVLEDRR